jgi:predicted AAA+ superfamily ATPase
MIERDIQIELTKSRKEYPVICITGPRQSGKTTLARAAFPKLPYVSFEEPVTRSVFVEDPKGFLSRYTGGAVFDEVQHVPELFSYLQVMADARPETGRFVLTGSQHFGLVEKISQSLAGRTAVLELLPFSADELQRGNWLSSKLNAVLWAGAYPPVHDRGLRPERWYANYLATYIQRDLRQITQVHNLDAFTRFIRLCAGSTGQLVNTNRLGTECGVDHKTIRRWLTVLQASYVIGLLPPYHRNFRKRLVKTPKLYFYDTGLACHLLGIEKVDQLDTHPLRGALFESWVFSELTKSLVNNGESPAIYFWRTHGGQEVDFLLERGGAMLAIEAKAGLTIDPTAVRTLGSAVQAWDDMKANQYIVFGGDDRMIIRGCTLTPWRNVSEVIKPLHRKPK